MGDLPRSARLYIVVVVVLATMAVGVAIPHVTAWLTVAELGGLFLLTALARRQIDRGSTQSLSFVVALAAIQILGVSGGVVVGLAQSLDVCGSIPLVKRLFNGAQFVVAAVAGGTTYVLLRGVVGHLGVHDFPFVLAPATASALVFFFVNVSLVGGIITLATGQSWWEQWRGSLSSFVAYLGYLPLSLALAALWTSTGPLAALLLLAPMFIAREVFGLSMAEQDSYDATVRALMAAVETKDIYTRGHSERVSRATGMLAHEVGYRGDKLESIKVAGLLHDVGKLGVSTSVLRKTGKLSDAEYDAIAQHPVNGVNMLGDIEFLRDALVAINHHHERLDGRGYPLGLKGNDIPEAARIVCVADAFDSMTSTRSYRRARSTADAIEELRRCAGTQFDPGFVEAFVRAVEREGWTPLEEAAADQEAAPYEERIPFIGPLPAPAHAEAS